MSLLFSDEELNHDRFDGYDKLYIKIINQFSQHLQDYGSGFWFIPIPGGRLTVFFMPWLLEIIFLANSLKSLFTFI